MSKTLGSCKPKACTRLLFLAACFERKRPWTGSWFEQLTISSWWCCCSCSCTLSWRSVKCNFDPYTFHKLSVTTLDVSSWTWLQAPAASSSPAPWTSHYCKGTSFKLEIGVESSWKAVAEEEEEEEGVREGKRGCSTCGSFVQFKTVEMSSTTTTSSLTSSSSSEDNEYAALERLHPTRGDVEGSVTEEERRSHFLFLCGLVPWVSRNAYHYWNLQ